MQHKLKQIKKKASEHIEASSPQNFRIKLQELSSGVLVENPVRENPRNAISQRRISSNH